MQPYALPAEAWAAGLVFARVAAVVMLIPGLGDASVPPRIRLSFALLLAMVIAPTVTAGLPTLPLTVGGMGGEVLQELIVGLLLGTLLRLFLNALSVAGEVVSIQTTLSFAQTANPLGAQTSTSLATFLVLLATVLVFATGLHHQFIGAIARSYQVFPAAGLPPVRDGATLAVQTVGQTFALGVQLAAPVIVFSLVFNVAAGLVGRVMPQFQLFFAVTPLAVLLGLAVFALSLGLVGLIWVERFEAFLARFA